MKENALYRALTSLKTAIFLLFLLSLLYLIGTVFPQGVTVEEYEKAGGTLLIAAKHLGVLHIFRTPLFFITAIILALNTLLCTTERFSALVKSVKKRTGEVRGKTVSIPENVSLSPENVKTLFSRKGFKVSEEKRRENGDTITFSKGFNLTALSVLFHFLIVTCLAAFFHTHLFSYENYFTIGEGDTTEIELAGGVKAPFKVKLNEFRTVYVDNPEITFPKKPFLRIASIVTEPAGDARFVLHEGAVSVTDWISDVSILEGEKEVKRSLVKVGSPLSHMGVRIYQMGYEQEISISAGGKKFDLSPGKPFEVRGKKFVVSAVRHGKLLKLDGSAEEVKPHVVLYRVTGRGKYDREKAGRIFLKKTTRVAGTKFSLLSFEEKSGFSYRVDPAAGYLYWAGFLVNILILLRLITTEEKIMVFIEKDGGGRVTLRRRGVFYRSVSGEKIVEEICRGD